MLIWRGLKPAAIVAAMLSVQSEWKRPEQRRAAAGLRSNGSGGVTRTAMPEAGQPQDSAVVPRQVLLDDGAAGSERPLH